MIVFINGFSTAGKSAIGKELSELLQLSFVDLDDWIEQQNVKSIADIISQEGEAHFREIEFKALQKVVKRSKEDTVIALGGGTACTPEANALILRSGISVYLKRPLDYFLEESFEELRQRPLYKDLSDESARNKIVQLFAKREAFYSNSQLETLVTSGFSPKKLANTLKLLTNRPQSL